MKNHTLKISASLMLLICSSVAVADPGYSMSDGMGGYYNSDGSSSMSDGMGGYYHSDGSSSMSDGMGGFYHSD